jgi:rfaE bifunctional protein kinase chain/domain
VTINQLVSASQSARILVVGDIMLDQYTHGKVKRICPEAPVPVALVDRETFNPGGAANVAANLAALGASTELFGFVGGDHYGKFLKGILKVQRIGCKNVIQTKGRVTTIKQRVYDRQQMIRIDREDWKQITERQVSVLISRIRRAIPSAHAVIVSDYAKGLVGQELMNEIGLACRKHRKFLSVNWRPASRILPISVDLVTVNRREVLEIAQVRDTEQISDVEEAVRIIYARYSPNNILVTLGAEGMLLFSHDREECLHIETQAREVADVCGAGDTVIAYFTLATVLKADGPTAAHFANRAAGIVVGKSGTAVALPDEMRTA